MSRLIFIPKAQAGESPLSVLQRASFNNGYHSLLSLLHALVPHIDHSNGMLGYVARNPKLYQRICMLIGIKERDISQSSYGRIGSAREDKLVWLGLQIPYNDVQFKTQKICIHCYTEKGFSLSEWEHKASTGCKDHHVLLEECCPVCHTLWSYDQAPLSCGCNTREITAQLLSIPAEQASLLHNFISSRNQSGIDSLSVAYQLIKWWQKIGISISRKEVSRFLFQLVNQQYPDLTFSGIGEKLHYQIFLMPLLTHHCEISKSMLATMNSKLTGNIFSLSIQHIMVNRKAVQNILSISRSRFDKFIHEGLISLNDKPLFALTEINNLLLSSKLLPFDDKDKKLTDFLLHEGRQTSLAKLVKAEISGNPLFSIISSQNNNHLKQNYITIKDAAEKLSSNAESIRYFIKSGKLIATKGTPKSPVQWAISINALEVFIKEYIFSSAISRQYGLPVTTTSSRLSSAGIKPISGPNIDGGKTYVFKTSDIKVHNLKEILKGSYQSPAGRKTNKQKNSLNQNISSHTLAKMLNISTYQVRYIVRDGWISGQKNSQGHYSFKTNEANQLAARIKHQYIDIESACQTLKQSIQSFRYIWIHTGFIQEHVFAKNRFITKEDFSKVTELWSKNATSTFIGQKIGRHRSFCINLEKIGLIKPTVILGNRIKLYPREHHLYKCYKIEK